MSYADLRTMPMLSVVVPGGLVFGVERSARVGRTGWRPRVRRGCSRPRRRPGAGSAEPHELLLELAGVVGLGQPSDPLTRGGKQDAVPRLASADRDPDGQVGLAGAGRAEEDHVLLRGDEVQGAEVLDQVAFEAAGVVEVELLQGLARGEPGGPDPAVTAVGLPGRHLALQAGDQELLVAPGLRPGSLGQPGHCLQQGSAPSTPGSGRSPRWPGRAAQQPRSCGRS
jgi:hypothetical protein